MKSVAQPGILLRPRGFSVVELLLAVGLLSMTALAFSALFTQQIKATNFLEFQTKKEQLRLSLLGQFLNDSNNCKCLFEGVGAFPTTGLSGLLSPRLKPTQIGAYSFTTPGDCSTAKVPVAQVTQDGFDGLKLNSVTLGEITPVVGGFQGQFVVNIQSMKEVLGPSSLTIKIPVLVDTVAGPAGQVLFNGCSMSGSKTTAVNMAGLLKSVKAYSNSVCLRSRSNYLFEVSQQCPSGYALMGCAGGPGDQDERYEAFWIVPNFDTNTCTLMINKPACTASQPVSYQKVIALCFPLQ